MYMFSMTSLTGAKKNAGRTMVLATFEISRRSFIVTVMALLVSILPVGLLAPLAFSFGMMPGVVVLTVVPLIVVSLTFFFVEGRTRDGLGLRRYEAMWDKRKASNGVVFVCNETISPSYLATVGPLDVEVRPEYNQTAPTAVLATPTPRRRKQQIDTEGWLK